MTIYENISKSLL